MRTHKIYKKFRWMKVFTLLLVSILQILCFFSCETKEISKTTPQQKNNPILEEILALEKVRLEATTQFDTTSLKPLLAPEFEMTSAQGEVLDTRQLLQSLNKKRQTQIQEKHYTKYTKVKLLNNADIALAKGMYIIERRENRGLIVLTLRYTDVYLRNADNRWLLESSHLSRISR